MTVKELELRLSILEAEVAHLKRRITPTPPGEGWLEDFVGAFDDKPEYEDVVRYGQEFRRAEQPTEDEEPES